ncbi:unnamed protein product [Linum tenue]|uniref:DYW domain-containing protein n=1 Tax=Linum tenue TaxID=586396 RepID=A0AAV0QHN5_9ROSI|nr:unnamed protein product [Linum tenue]
MVEWEHKLNRFTLSTVLKGCAKSGHLKEGKLLHSVAIKTGQEVDEFVASCLVDMYSKCGMTGYALQVFKRIKDPDLVTWSAMISGLDQQGCSHDAAELYKAMVLAGVRPNQYIFSSLVSAATNVHFGRQVHTHIIKNCNDSNDFVRTALIDMYAKGRCIEDAVAVFNRLVDRDLFTWTTMIDGYAKTNQPEMALKHFVDMQSEGVKPNEFTIASCLNACSHMATLEGGQQLHSMVVKAGHTGDIIVATAITDMYGKCGCLEDAEANFKYMVLRDAVSWNTIIAVYAYHSQGENALQAYRMMIEKGFLPDEATFLSILSVCSNMGLVEEGKKHFESMSKVYGITPTLEHYACVVNILSRAGQFDEVEAFIKEQKLSTHALIWETVLGACKLHGNLDLGETAARKLFELQPKEDSAYIFLSNIFASKGRWDDVQKIRVLMSEEGIKKEPGCSWVGVDGQVHVFVSQDGSHPKTEQIYAKLQDLKQRLSFSGYIPKTENVLHNISSREKIEHLWHHSERLALGLALISASPGMPIRIFKNLRICEDCHEVMKVISYVTSREIVIRDFKRFHHFKLGSCSCQDSW